MTQIELTASLEDYLEAFYEITQEKNGAKAVDIAKKLNVQRSSVTEALKNLSSKGLVNYGRYEVISLTEKGVEVAQKVIEKHETLYDFLTTILGVEKNEASKFACKIEHNISDEVLNRLLCFIKYYKQNNNHCLSDFQDFYKSKK